MIKKIPLFLIYGCLFSSICLAQEFQLPATEYPSGFPLTQFLDVYSQSESLQNWAVVQDENGILYIGTIGGLMIYDGVRWSKVRLPNLYVVSLGIDSKGTVFVGGHAELGYLMQGDGTEPIRYVSLNEKLPSELTDDMFSEVWQVEPVEEGIYFRAGRYLLLWTGHEFKYQENESDFTHITHFRDEVLVNIRNKGVYRVTEEFELEQVEYYRKLIDSRIIGFHEIDNSTDLIITLNQGLIKVTPNGFERIETEASAFLEENDVTKSVQLHDGSVVVGTFNAGMIRVSTEGDILSQMDSSHGLPEDNIFDLYVGQDGSLWVTHERNLTKVDFHIPVRKFDHRNGLRGTVMEIVIHNDVLFVASTHGIYRMTDFDGRFEQINPGKETCYGIENYGDDIIAECMDEFFIIKNDEIVNIASEDGIRTKFLKRSELREEWIYAGTENGLKIIDMNKLTFTKLIPGISSFPTSIVEHNGEIWIGLNDGNVNVYTKEQLEGWIRDESPEIDRRAYRINMNRQDIQAVHIFQFQGRLLFSTSSNIYRFDDENDRFVVDHVFGDEFNNRGNQLFRFHEDHIGNAWMRYGNKELVAWKEDDGTFNISTNLLSRIVDSQVLTIKTDNYNTVWYGGSEGLHRYHYDMMMEYKPVANAFIRQVFIGTDSLIADFPGRSDQDLNSLTIEYGYNELRFTYALTSFDNPEEIWFRYKLENFDNDWSDWINEAQKDYTNISEGSYTFLVQGLDTYGNVYEASGFSFTILPPWYRTWWAYLLYMITVSGILYTFHKIRVNRILEVQRIRNRIASDLHDEISATLSSISFFADAIRQKKDRNEDKEQRFIELISKSAGEAKENMSDIIWSINPENDDWKALLAKCRRFASDMLESRDIQYTLDIAEDIPKGIDIELRQHIWLIFKEMVTNAARHSGASRVRVTLKYIDYSILMEIADNGQGFNPDENEIGNGIKNIKRRSEKIGAQVDINSGPGGTVWTLVKRF